MSKQENLIPEAAVEAAAKAAYEFRYSGYKSWDDLTPNEQYDAEAEMQFALLAAAPHMRGPLRDVLAMCDKADTDPGPMCGKLTTWEIRQALGANGSTPDA